ncbi:MAG: YaaA family protein [Spirochaetales bacterium]|nr:YaaA family protein [Spirochaetales bacterium]
MNRVWSDALPKMKYPGLDSLRPGADFDLSSTLREALGKKSLGELVEYFGVSHTLGQEIHDLYQVPGVLRPMWTWYAGEAFKYLGLRDFFREPQESMLFQRASRGILVLSALYGCLLPWENIQGYRLDFTLPMPDGSKQPGLRALWSSRVISRINTLSAAFDTPLCISCASEEYESVLHPTTRNAGVWLERPLVRIQFIQSHPKTGKPARISARAKQARGIFARWVIETLPEEAQNVDSILRHLKSFDREGYTLCGSTEQELTFSQVAESTQ